VARASRAACGAALVAAARGLKSDVVDPRTVIYAIADQEGWLVSEALEHALATLKRELAGRAE
jgi:hypothetical protein